MLLLPSGSAANIKGSSVSAGEHGGQWGPPSPQSRGPGL